MSTFTGTSNSEAVDLYQFVYISRITSTGLSGASTLNDIAETSIKNNKNNHITGILCYGNGYFFQCIEGTEQALTNLKNQLLMDDRHKDLQTLSFSAIEARRFQSWSLRSIVLERWLIKDPTMKALMPFKPYAWSMEESKQFLELLQHYYENQEQKDEVDMQPIKYNALGITLFKVVGQHQAFFLIQTVLSILILLTLLWFILSDKLYFFS
ncbi:BLUF domain-containing protein [Psychrobacter frigidicola]|uniref:BLUF domain-containing protein n=1 Tax=Psychrobacter frigidicola TaxID=45611 RepID=A0A5C7A4M9_9GAMM|nr:BLUF domain-containing protein [Psychrobacter frigidicola]TXD98381.1 BLUF domain-containing protein [Psychrobacter frigidicola]